MSSPDDPTVRAADTVAAVPGIDPGQGAEALPTVERRHVEQATMAVYALITLLGVVSAAASKDVAEDSAELGVIIIGTTITLMIAHAWAAVVAHRLVQGHRLTRSQIATEFRHDLAFLVTGAFGLATLTVSVLLTDDYRRQVDYEQAFLVLGLVTVGVIGARRSGATWPKSLAWGGVDGLVGLFIVALKLTLGH